VSIHGGEGPKEAEALFAALGEAEVDVDMIVQARARSGGAVVECSVAGRDLPRALAAAEAFAARIGGLDVRSETDLAKVSVVGTGLRGRADVARTLYACWAGRAWPCACRDQRDQDFRPGGFRPAGARGAGASRAYRLGGNQAET
jgi:aspartokinase